MRLFQTPTIISQRAAVIGRLVVQWPVAGSYSSTAASETVPVQPPRAYSLPLTIAPARLARLTFMPLAVGSSDLGLENVTLTTPLGVNIPQVSMGGVVEVRAGLIGDVDDDCDVDIRDIMLVAGRWGSHSGDANYEPRYDLDGDGDIDITDVMTVVAHWGESCGQGVARVAPEPLSAAVSMNLLPAQNVAQPGDVFPLDVQVQGVTDLGGVEFTLQFDPALVHVESVDLGDMLKQSARTFSMVEPAINNDLGVARVAIYSVGATPVGPSGTGTVAVLSMRAVAPGSGRVEFAAQPPAQITDSLGALQEPLSLNGADVTVAGAGGRRVYLPAVLKR